MRPVGGADVDGLVVFDDAEDAGALEAGRVHHDRRLLVLRRRDTRLVARLVDRFGRATECGHLDVLQVDLTAVHAAALLVDDLGERAEHVRGVADVDVEAEGRELFELGADVGEHDGRRGDARFGLLEGFLGRFLRAELGLARERITAAVIRLLEVGVDPTTRIGVDLGRLERRCRSAGHRGGGRRVRRVPTVVAATRSRDERERDSRKHESVESSSHKIPPGLVPTHHTSDPGHRGGNLRNDLLGRRVFLTEPAPLWRRTQPSVPQWFPRPRGYLDGRRHARQRLVCIHAGR